MKKAKKSIYLRYEFTNEKGMREGGDIFEYSTLTQAQEMISEILKVTLSDGVAVNVTLGESKPFMGFLKGAGLTQEQIDAEKVDFNAVSASEKAGKTTKKKPAAKKATKKKAAK
ncbi:MAG: hypothetical protein ACJ763_11365 [Bdellovibrionia bacterium]